MGKIVDAMAAVLSICLEAKMIAGLDIGTSRVKMVFEGERLRDPEAKTDVRYLTDPFGFTPEMLATNQGVAAFEARLDEHGITCVSATGTGAPRFMSVCSLCHQSPSATRDPILHEIQMQAMGVIYLLAMEGVELPLDDGFLIVSIGTGTSFSLAGRNLPGAVDDKIHARPYSPGLSIGGGMVEQLASMQGIEIEDLEENVRLTMNPDLLIGDVFPGAPKDIQQMVVASFGKLGNYVGVDRQRAFCTGLVRLLAVVSMGHVMSIAQHPMYQWGGKEGKNIIFLGTPVAKSPSLQVLLRGYSEQLRFTPWIPKHAQYAGAFGAFGDQLYAESG
jgi:hypothetical protein